MPRLIGIFILATIVGLVAGLGFTRAMVVVALLVPAAAVAALFVYALGLVWCNTWP